MPQKDKLYSCVLRRAELIVFVPGGLGGAVAVDTSQATLGGSIFTANSATSQGGALYQVSTLSGSLQTF